MGSSSGMRARFKQKGASMKKKALRNKLEQFAELQCDLSAHITRRIMLSGSGPLTVADADEIMRCIQHDESVTR